MEIGQSQAAGILAMGQLFEGFPAARPFQPQALGNLAATLERGEVVPLGFPRNDGHEVKRAPPIVPRLARFGVRNLCARGGAALSIDCVLAFRVAVGRSNENVDTLGRASVDKGLAKRGDVRVQVFEFAAIDQGSILLSCLTGVGMRKIARTRRSLTSKRAMPMKAKAAPAGGV